MGPGTRNPPKFNGLHGGARNRRCASWLLAFGEHRLGQPEAIDADRNAAVDRDLGQPGADLVVSKPTAQRAAHVGLELLHLSQRGDHAEIEDRALARAEPVIAPGLAPTILGDDALEVSIEMVGALE